MSGPAFITGSLSERLAAYLYAGCLGRPCTVDELTEAAKALERGMEPCELALRLLRSPEVLSTSRFVALLYPALLQRAPEYWTWRIHREAVVTGRLTRVEIVQYFLSSVEHAIRFRTRTDEEFIRMIWGAVNGQPPRSNE